MDTPQIELISILLTTFQDGNMPTFLFLGIMPMTKNKKTKKQKQI